MIPRLEEGRGFSMQESIVSSLVEDKIIRFGKAIICAILETTIRTDQITERRGTHIVCDGEFLRRYFLDE